MNSTRTSSRSRAAGFRGALARLVGGMSVFAAAAAMLVLTPPGFAQSGSTPEKEAIKKAQEDTSTKDVLIFKNGKIIEGKILDETPTTIKLLVKLGTLSAPTEYQKADILEIQRGVATGEPKKGEPAKAPDGDKDKKDSPAAGGDTGEKPVKIYLVELTGEAFRDVSRTPMRKIVHDIVEQEPDYVVYEMNFDFSVYQKQSEDFEWGYDALIKHVEMLESARELDTIINDELSINYPKAKKPVLVSWIKKAMGSAAFIPLSFSNTYYTSDGKHGGLGYLDFLFAGKGDEIVRDKQRSLRLGRALGLGNKGGYPEVIVRAMTNTTEVLSVDYVGGRPIYHEDYSGQVLLTDSGVGAERDSVDDAIRGRGNDNLTLTADVAYNLGISKGTADTIDDLANQLGVSRHYEVIRDYPDRTLGQWREDVNNAETNIKRLLREFRSVRLEGNDYNARKLARGKQISLLQQASALFDQYRESINPYNFGDAQNNISQISVIIDQLKTAQRLDRR